MSTASAPSGPGQNIERQGGRAAGQKPLLFDLDGIDLDRIAVPRDRIGRWIPHRGMMAFLDGIVWHSEDCKRGVGVKHVRDDEFWVDGHFPGRPMMPGVLQVECGAQLGAYLYNIRFSEPRTCAFTRIENAVFRTSVRPGDALYILAVEVRFNRRRFVSDIQGIVDSNVAFEARINGMVV